MQVSKIVHIICGDYCILNFGNGISSSNSTHLQGKKKTKDCYEENAVISTSNMDSLDNCKNLNQIIKFQKFNFFSYYLAYFDSLENEAKKHFDIYPKRST